MVTMNDTTHVGRRHGARSSCLFIMWFADITLKISRNIKYIVLNKIVNKFTDIGDHYILCILLKMLLSTALNKFNLTVC